MIRFVQAHFSTVRAFFKLPGSRSFVALLACFFAVAIAAVVVLCVHYRAADQHGLSLAQSLYAVLNLLFFNAVYPFPDDALTRIVFFAVPIFGILVIGQFAVRLGTALLNREKWERAVASTYRDHVIVCGLGRVAIRVVRWLLDLGEPVVVIERDPANEFLDQVRGWGVPVLIGDARLPELLEQAGITEAASIAPISSDDLLNLTIATEARNFRPEIRVVLRTFEDRLASNLQQGFDIHAAYSTSALAAPAFAAAATRAPVDHAFSFVGARLPALITVTKFTVVPESPLVGRSIAELEEEFDVRVIAHRRTEFVVHPRSDVVLERGDGFVVSATIDRLNRLARLTPPTRYLARYEQGRWPIETTAVPQPGPT
jgi:voltage-gated potassium channel